MSGVMQVLDGSGRTEHKWDVGSADATEVKTVFDKLVNEEKALAYTVNADGTSDKIKSFDESAAQIIVSPQHVGG